MADGGADDGGRTDGAGTDGAGTDGGGPDDGGTPGDGGADASPTDSGTDASMGGAYVWDHVYGGDTAGGRGWDIATDDRGDIAVAGEVLSATSIDLGGGDRPVGGAGMFVLGLSPDGSYRWDRVVADARARVVAVDGSGNVVAAGFFSGTVDFDDRGPAPPLTSLNQDAFAVSYGSDGSYRWARRFGSSGGESAGAAAADASGRIYVGGSYSATTDFGGGDRSVAGSTDAFVVALDSGGGYRWDYTFGGGEADDIQAIATDAAGNVYVAGSIAGSVDLGGGGRAPDARDLFVLALGSDGGYLWDRVIGGSGNDFARDVAVDGSGRVLVAGHFEGSVDFGGGTRTSPAGQGAFVLVLGSDGSYSWDRTFSGDDDDTAHGVTADPAGNVAVTGAFASSIDFGGGERANDGLRNIFVLGLGPDGGYRWDAAFVAGDNRGAGWDVAAGDVDETFVAGHVAGTVDFGGGVRDAGGEDIFVVGLGPVP